MSDVLHTLAGHFDSWLKDSAFPLWWKQGADRRQGGFFEVLGQDGLALPQARRARVQSRQSYAYALAGTMGWQGPWQAGAMHGLSWLSEKYQRADGQFSTLAANDGRVLDEAATLYDQAFVLLALAQLYRIMPERANFRSAALALLEVTRKARGHAQGGYAESAENAFQANPHMHLLEAALAWCEIDPGTVWDALADELVALCLCRFIDPQSGALREFFDAHWHPLAGPKGRIIEPGHQFEWAWLLERWGRRRQHEHAREAAKRLYTVGLSGIDRKRGVAMDEMSPELAVTRATARLWPQTEWIKASAVLAQAATGAARVHYVSEAIAGAHALERYLQTPVAGLWRDKMTEAGTFVDEPAPASSFYHIVCCIACLNQVRPTL